jgi:hypothetical protein
MEQQTYAYAETLIKTTRIPRLYFNMISKSSTELYFTSLFEEKKAKFIRNRESKWIIGNIPV